MASDLCAYLRGHAHLPTSLRWRVAQWLELRWWRSYLSGRSSEEYLADKRAYWERLLTQLGWEVQAGARVLDAGCGPAGIFIYLADRQEVTAVDPLLDRYSGLAVFDPARYPAVRFRRSKLESYRAGRPFDRIYCLNAINHVSDWAAALDALTAAARPGTRMLLSSDVHRPRLVTTDIPLVAGGCPAPAAALADRLPTRALFPGLAY